MKLTFVHFVDQIRFEPGTAQLVALARREGCDVHRVALSYGTATDAFFTELETFRPDAVLFHVTGETREAVEYTVRTVRERRPDLDVLVHGPLADAPAELLGAGEGTFILTGDPEAALVEIVRAGSLEGDRPAGVARIVGGAVEAVAPARAFDPADAPLPDLECFGGPSLFRRPTGASFFGDVGVAPLEIFVGTPSGPSPHAGFCAFNHPTSGPPRRRPLDRLEQRVAELAPHVHGFEIVDREPAHDPEHAIAVLDMIRRTAPGHTVTVRALASTLPLDAVDQLDPALVTRLVLECDVVDAESFGRLPGTQPPERVAAATARARERGLSVGLLVSVGLPFETAADIDRKLGFIRRAGVTRARFVPFEPRFGSELHELCRSHGMLARGNDAWNREVYHRLNQDSISDEEWFEAWQRCLDLQAELQLRYPAHPTRTEVA